LAFLKKYDRLIQIKIILKKIMQIYNVFMSSLLDANKTIEKQTAATETAQTS
jgi:hypothetical protein